MGEQPPAFDWHWRRYRLGDAVQRLGSHLAHSETPDSVDPRQCHQRNSNAGEGKTHGTASVSSIAVERLLICGDAVLHGRSQPLSDVWEVVSFGGPQGKIRRLFRASL